jgi:cytochrome c biogenesis protein CcmG/thiol:disulfide interchange protein DsbE
MKKTRFKSLANSCFWGAILLIGAFLAAACDSAAPPQPSRPIRDLTPSEITKLFNSAEIKKLDGEAFKLSDFQGKVLVVDFWATYCPPCVRQVPQLAELSRKYRDQGLEVVGLTSDEKADQTTVVEFLKKAGVDYTIGYAEQPLSSEFLRGTEDNTGNPPIPQLFVFSRDGRIVEHMIGDNPQRGIKFLERVVSQELAAR